MPSNMSDIPAEIAARDYRKGLNERLKDREHAVQYLLEAHADIEGFRLALDDVICAAQSERIRELEQQPKWVCFHCEFATSDPKEAANHFGDRDDEAPVCVTWGSLDADGRASEYQSTLGELNAERDENAKLRTANEGLEYRLLEYESLVGSRFKGCRSINDAFNLYDSMEGRALVAEQANKELLNLLARVVTVMSKWPKSAISEDIRAALSKHGGG